MTISLIHEHRVNLPRALGHVPFGEKPFNADGVRRVSLFLQRADGGAYGDDARGYAWESRYVSDDGERCAEVAVYPSLESWGWDVVVRTMAGDAIGEDETEWPRPDDTANITYEHPHHFEIDLLQEAQDIANRIGQQDHSPYLMLRRQEASP
jgi:hypothetical protein